MPRAKQCHNHAYLKLTDMLSIEHTHLRSQSWHTGTVTVVYSFLLQTATIR